MKSLFADIGSTFVKYAIYDGECVLRDKIPFPKPMEEAVFTVARKEIEDVLLAVMAVAEEHGCTRSFFSVQMHGYLLRYPTGVFSDYFSWRSGGGDNESEALLSIDFAKRGTSLKPNLPLAKLYSKRETLQGAEFFTLGSYIAYLLTGTNATHKTDACASGFFGADDLTPDTETVRGLRLPRVYAEMEPCGVYHGIQIFTPVGDHAASVYGCEPDGDAYLLNIGTTSQIAFVREGSAPAGAWECRPYFEKGKRLFTLGNLFYGLYGDPERYCAEAIRIIESLPRRSRILLGGGGASGIAERLSAMLSERGITCTCIGCDIGVAGLARLADRVKPRLGSMLSEIPFTNMPLLMKNAGLDFLLVDNEHGAFDYATLAKLFTVARLAEMQTIVRLPDNTRAWITKCVDAGADGFLLPMTDTAEDIAKVVEYAKYAPVGKRGISTMRAHTLYDPPSLDAYMPAANERIKVYAQIETAKGVANIEAILATEGLDGVFVGPNDLSCDLGCIGETAPILAAMEKVANAAKCAGKPWGIITTTGVLLEKAQALGVRMISYGSELNMLANACKEIKSRFI